MFCFKNIASANAKINVKCHSNVHRKLALTPGANHSSNKYSHTQHKFLVPNLSIHELF